MPRTGLTRERIIDCAIALIEERGNHAFTLGALARTLSIKPASLYHHFEHMEELTGEVGLRIGRMIRDIELAAIEGCEAHEALRSLFMAYRRFAIEHADLYKVIMGMQKDKNAHTEAACGEMIEPILRVLAMFRLTEERAMHWQRIVRAMMHGFITHEFAGGFRHCSADASDTYCIAIEVMIQGLLNEQEKTI